MQLYDLWWSLIFPGSWPVENVKWLKLQDTGGHQRQLINVDKDAYNIPHGHDKELGFPPSATEDNVDILMYNRIAMYVLYTCI